MQAFKDGLGIRRLVLQIHDASFPSRPDEEVGRGSPYSAGARDFLSFAQELGFDGVQLGPQGQTSFGNPCPYDGRLFPRNFLSVALESLTRDPYWRGVLSEDTLERVVEGTPGGTGRCHHQYAWTEISAALDESLACLRAAGTTGDPLERDFAAFQATNAEWLERDAGGDFERHAFAQFILDQQHRQLREQFPGLRFYGDLQVGTSPDDARQFAQLFHPHYRMGAPPSRTNPDGQPWGYAIFDPRQVEIGAASQFLRQRVGRMLDGFDGIRIDHPHGLVCPWVYRSDADSPQAAVQAGARMYESPDLDDHPNLADFHIARTEQIDGSQTRYAENRVRELDDAQVERYSVLIDVVLDVVRAAGGAVSSDVACEVLSTLPYPLSRVMQRHGLGRFRVIQKAKLDDPSDVYRIEQAQPADWIMLGNHDTPPIWLLARGWCNGGRALEWAEYLADRLWVPASTRSEFLKRTSDTPGNLVNAVFAAMLASDAGHVSVFFTDLLGMSGLYNRPGFVAESNWSLRVPADFAERYRERVSRGEALDVKDCLRLAAEARKRFDRTASEA